MIDACHSNMVLENGFMLPMSECCGRGQWFDMDGEWIVCHWCKAKYRPTHKGHTGGGTPDNCDYCQLRLNEHR